MSHKVNGVNDELTIDVQDEPGHGGACHRYMISFPNPMVDNHYLIAFQDGPIKEVGTNGLTHEALLAILIDRMEGFQSGPYANEDNHVALVALKAALDALKLRTERRLARGVEGTHQK